MRITKKLIAIGGSAATVIAMAAMSSTASASTQSHAAVESGALPYNMARAATVAHDVKAVELNENDIVLPSNGNSYPGSPTGPWADDGDEMCIFTNSSGDVEEESGCGNGVDYQLDFVLQTGECNNGYVDSSTSCPFPSGSGLNATYKNDAIVEIQSPHSYCISAPSNETPSSDASCDENGLFWVIDQPSSGFWLFINKYWTNYFINTLGNPDIAGVWCSPDRSGQDFFISQDGPSNAYCTWEVS
jgi:hypothetical protein